MNWEMVGSISELLAAIGVIASLIYVGKQVKGGSKQTRINTSFSIASNAQDGWAPIYNSSDHSRIWNTSLTKVASLPEEDLGVFLLFFDRQLFNYETAIVAYEEGAFDEDLFATNTTLFRALIHSSGGKYWVKNEGFPLTDRARRYLDVT